MPKQSCPSCKRLLAPCGEVEFEGKAAKVYQCEHCIKKTTLMGVEVEVHVTFAVDAAGNVFDPDQLEP